MELEEKSALLGQTQQHIQSMKAEYQQQVEEILKKKESSLRSTTEIQLAQLMDRIRELENQIARLELEKQHMKSVSFRSSF